jgi:glyoxylase-like metal-dependent hydrolase (beta-lactamase superfamily II)
MNNPAFIESKNGIIVIDPGGNYNVGVEILKELRKVTKKPILAILNTHKHGDHWFANIAFAKENPKIPIYAHPNMIKAVKEGEADKWYGILDRLSKNLKGTKPYKFPNHEIKDKEKLEIDGEKFIFYHPKKAHTNTDILIEHINSNTLFLGDNLMKNRLGGFDDSSSIIENIKLLENILKENKYSLYVPGHGSSGKAKETIEPFLTYLKILKKYAKKAYDDDKEYYGYKTEAIKELEAFKKWDAFNHQMGKHLNKVYQEIEESDM